MFSSVCVVASCHGGGYGKDEEAQEYELLTVKTENFETTAEYAARIRGRQDIRIIPKVDGYLQEIRIREGERVKAGQLLFVIDQTSYKAALKSAEAAVLQAKSRVSNAQLEYDGKQSLYAKGIVSDFDLTCAKLDLEAAQADYEAAQAGLEAARNDLSFTELRSPSDGVVGSIPYRKGDYVGPTVQDGLTIISDNGQMYVYFSLSESRIMQYITEFGSMSEAIANMPRPQLLLTGSKLYPHSGVIESVSGIVDDKTGAVSVRAVFENPEGMLLSGGTARVVMPQVMSGVIVIPAEATYEILDKVYVFKVEDGIAHSCVIETEKVSDGKRLVVTGGLNAGDVIIGKGAGLVQEGAAVKETR